ncbi:MAG: LPS export ABC transporter periplasmic protein LptC [Alphaproteobacteria bacterium]|nr:LPS export ABC transporter periplasmic protein LptC [Alphaproteobacteria bacterium]
MQRSHKDHFTSTERAREEAVAALSPVAHHASGPAWDKFIRLMRVLLPVVAVILGSVTLLWPILNETEVSFTLSKEEVAKSDGVIRMTNLQYAGTDGLDRLFRVRAASGQQENPHAPRVRLTDIQAEMELEPGTPATVEARTGIYRTKDGTLSLLGGVHVNTTNGYKLEMTGAEVDLKKHSATGHGDIQGLSDLGRLEAGRMEIDVDKREGNFDGGVKLAITPKRPSANTNKPQENVNSEAKP